MNPELKRAAKLAAEYIESFDHHKVSEEIDPQELRDKLQKELTADGLPPFIDTATEALALLYLFTTLAVMSLVGLFCLYWKQIRQVRNSKLFELILI